MGENVVTKEDVRGTASGMMFMAFFGTVWADIGIGGLQVSGAIWLLILAILIGAALFFSGIRMIRSLKNLPSTNKSRHAKNVNKWFNIVFAAQFGLIVMAAVVTNVIGYFDWFFSDYGYYCWGTFLSVSLSLPSEDLLCYRGSSLPTSDNNVAFYTERNEYRRAYH